ncbi:hypothetical protein [Flavobacterium sp.]|uniref:hypothetical protein n=1 Tax=Flavobacterium sp. TaxID=239 RepID=UPI002A825F1F|nr:hypothetical protein [Flavobacterium sp.]
MKIEGGNNLETQQIDSLNYKSQHKLVADILKEKEIFDLRLQNNGFFEAELTKQTKTNDSTFLFQYKLGLPVKNIHIYVGKVSDDILNILQIESDSIQLKISETESWMQSKVNLLEKKGYSLAKLSLTNHKENNHTLTANLFVELNQKRTVDDLVILGYDKFPTNIKKNWVKKYKKRIFNQDLVKEINDDFSELPFITQTKYPEILFTDSSTKIYAYLEKSTPNKFDGFIGFSNDENSKLVFNGYLDLSLQNIFNSGEKFKLYWKNDGKQQTSFNLGTELPYLFKSPLGLKTDLRIFKKDSTFQNTIVDLNLGYYFTYNKKVYLGFQNTKSVDIQKANSDVLNNFTNTFYTTSFEYFKRNLTDFLFPERINFIFKTGVGNRKIKSENTSQFFGQIDASHTLYLNTKNNIRIKNQTFYLNSDTYIVNELYRFGGINSIRGFRENSLQANFFSGLMLEYNYILAPNMYVHSITDYGYFQDKASNLQNSLLGLGFGFGLLTNNGLFNLVYANGSTNEQAIKLSNSIIHISFKTNF